MPSSKEDLKNFRNPVHPWRYTGTLMLEPAERAMGISLDEEEGRAESVPSGGVLVLNNGLPVYWDYEVMLCLRDRDGKLLWVNHANIPAERRAPFGKTRVLSYGQYHRKLGLNRHGIRHLVRDCDSREEALAIAKTHNEEHGGADRPVYEVYDDRGISIPIR